MEQDATTPSYLDALCAFSQAFDDATGGRLRRSSPSAFEAALAADVASYASAPPVIPPRRPRMALGDFKRDLEGKNVLIGKRWGVRGTIVMVVSSTGSGKSVAQTQMAASFALGIPCCGLAPTRPFRSWIIQSEDDEDRVAIDRDDIFAEMEELYPDADFGIPRRDISFLDFTSFTGAKFLDELKRELALSSDAEKPDCIFINPMNAYFGGSLKEGVDCSAFFKGGMLGGKETDGLEAIAKEHNVLVIIFGHTPKPPTPKELEDWTNDPNICYKMCGASEIADAVRSILVFLRVPGTDDTFVFNAGKNGYTLGWTDALGNKTTKSYWRWAASGRHFWEEVPKDEWPSADMAKAETARDTLDSDIAALLPRMTAPGLNVIGAVSELKAVGIGSRRASAAFYAIVRDQMKYRVIRNVVQGENGHFKTLFHTVDQSQIAPSPAQSQAAPPQETIDTDGLFDDQDIPPF